MSTTKRIGPSMQVALAYIQAHPGCTAAQVDRAVRTMARVQCCEVYETIQAPNGSVCRAWVWAIIGDGELRFVASPDDAPKGAVIKRRGVK